MVGQKRGPQKTWGPKDPELRRLLYLEALEISGWFTVGSLQSLCGYQSASNFCQGLVNSGDLEEKVEDGFRWYRWIN